MMQRVLSNKRFLFVVGCAFVLGGLAWAATVRMLSSHLITQVTAPPNGAEFEFGQPVTDKSFHQWQIVEGEWQNAATGATLSVTRWLSDYAVATGKQLSFSPPPIMTSSPARSGTLTLPDGQTIIEYTINTPDQGQHAVDASTIAGITAKCDNGMVVQDSVRGNANRVTYTVNPPQPPY